MNLKNPRLPTTSRRNLRRAWDKLGKLRAQNKRGDRR